MKRLPFFLVITLFIGLPAAGVKYVAVVETEVDAASGASAAMNPAEVRQVTAELRRQATENLPPDRYSVMTSETVQSMGGAVLEECAEENCVITLGSKIGADYIVRGTVSKFQTKFTLTVELYETEYGTLVVTSEPVRSENPAELLETASAACANMYRKFAGAKQPEQAKTGRIDALNAKKSADAKRSERKSYGDNTAPPNKSGRGYYFAPKYQVPVGTPVSWGGVNLEGGWTWGNGVFLGIDLSFGGEYTSDSAGNILAGFGMSLGDVYDLWNQLQLVYGGSVGIFFAGSGRYRSNGSGDTTYWAHNFLAPFVKLRWNYLELTYRGLLGISGVDYDVDDYNYDHNESFGWNHHQLMLGLYFATSRRDR